MEQTYLPGKIRDRIQNLMKSRKVTQAELATRIGVSESSLSRFISSKTDKLGDENIIRMQGRWFGDKNTVLPMNPTHSISTGAFW